MLSNNNFQFKICMFFKLVGTGMGPTFVAPYTSFSVGYLEGSILFPRLLPLNFTLMECKSIEEIFKRFPLILIHLESLSRNYIPH